MGWPIFTYRNIIDEFNYNNLSIHRIIHLFIILHLLMNNTNFYSINCSKRAVLYFLSIGSISGFILIIGLYIFSYIFIVMSIILKLPLYPFELWLPDVHGSVNSIYSAVLSACQIKLPLIILLYIEFIYLLIMLFATSSAVPSLYCIKISGLSLSSFKLIISSASSIHSSASALGIALSLSSGMPMLIGNVL